MRMITNKEKFKEIFGFSPSDNGCIAPKIVCEANNSDCKGCPFLHWFDREYKECFKLKANLGGANNGEI